MTMPLPRVRGSRPITLTTVLGLVLIPLIVAGMLIWGLWKPTERLEHMTAAVVNLDEPVEVDGQTVPLGRVLAGSLVGDAESRADDTNFTWVLTDEEDASDGLADGRYASVVTIPENFSAAATSTSDGPDAATQARISISESDRGRLLDQSLTTAVTATATAVLNEQLGESFVGNVFVGMTELRSGISDAETGAAQLASGGSQLAQGTGELADGADQLVSGSGQLADGAGQLASGTGELATGAGSLASGVGELNKGAQQLNTGSSDLADGASTLASGSSDLADGADKLASGLSELSNGNGRDNPGLTGYAQGVRLFASGNGADSPGMAGLAEGVQQYTDGVNTAIGGLQQGSGAAVSAVQQLREAIAAGVIPLEPGQDQATVLAQLDALIAQLQAAASDDPATSPLAALKQQGTALADGVNEAAAGAEELAVGAEGFAEGASTLAAGADQLASGAHDLSTGASQLSGGATQLSQGVNSLASGTGELSSGADQLASGAGELSAGAQTLSSGTAELAAQTPELADGARELADGAEQSAEGAAALADGLGQAVTGIPDYTEQQRETMATAAITPVVADGASTELLSDEGTPLFAGLALWAGALGSFLVLSPLWRRARTAARGVGYVALRSALPAVGIGAAQGALIGIALPIALGYSVGTAAAFAGLSVIGGVAFSLLVQGLAALMGGVGRFVAFVVLVLALAAGVVSTAPAGVLAAGDATPVGALLDGLRDIGSGGGGGGSALLLTLWALGGFALLLAAVARARARS